MLAQPLQNAEVATLRGCSANTWEPRHSHSGGHTAELQGGLLRLQPRMYLRSRHSLAPVPTGARPGGLLLLPPCTSRSLEQRPAGATTAALPAGLRWLH